MDETPSWKPTLLKCAAAMTAAVAVCTWVASTLARWLRGKVPGWIPDKGLREIIEWALSRMWVLGTLAGFYLGVVICMVLIALDARKGRLPPWR